jgi:prepilin-type N-terminal cleavage/methylation domain-containing protein
MTHGRVRVARVRHAFTTIEMLIVLVIISLTVAWALPRFSISRFRADAAGRLVRSILQTAQRNAITRQSNVIISFDSAGRRMRIFDDVNNNGAIDAGELVQYRQLAEASAFVTPNWAGVNGTVPGGSVTGSGLVTIASLPSVVFGRDGSASTTLEIYVTTRAAVPTEYRAILVTASTGRTAMYKWNGSIWLAMTQ